MKKLFLVPLMAAFALGTLSMTSCGSDKDKPAPKPTPDQPTPNKPDPNKPTPSTGTYDESRVLSDVYFPKEFSDKSEIMAAFSGNETLKTLFKSNPAQDDPDQKVLLGYTLKEGQKGHFLFMNYIFKPTKGPAFLNAVGAYKKGTFIDDSQQDPQQKYANFMTLANEYAKAFGGVIGEGKATDDGKYQVGFGNKTLGVVGVFIAERYHPENAQDDSKDLDVIRAQFINNKDLKAQSFKIQKVENEDLSQLLMK